ncbi:MAG: hypothetical protein AVDCRST_MAG61-115 [uncultured Friedmanniella sp.]|uniref:Uncharacterized protein n=1 Tax=uncultured Friedmanniella sp. TaxID=335381 RepID=A0A6J4JV02_9ACTN|nr:MAG: hypothetical protein AVDCRST_MAG61-115 [uncultured Friedmanniella sp.]
MTPSTSGVGFLGTVGVAEPEALAVVRGDADRDGVAGGEPAAVVGPAEGSVGAGSARQPSIAPTATAVEACRSERLVTMAAILLGPAKAHRDGRASRDGGPGPPALVRRGRRLGG